MHRKRKKNLCYPIIWALLMSVVSCGLRDIPEPVFDEEAAACSSGQMDSGNDSESAAGGNERTAVSDFYYLKLPELLGNDSGGQYQINGEWLYRMESRLWAEEGSAACTFVSRSRIADGYQEENYIVEENDGRSIQVFLADGEGNCYLFWGPEYGAEEDAVYVMEKYGLQGELLWQVGYAPEELMGEGERLAQGAVTENGRIFLYSYGERAQVFAFGEDGKLEETYAPALKSLEGIAVGNEGRVYGYYVTGEAPLFMELGKEEASVCPVVPLQVYDGHEDGICLRTKEGMWRYEPDTGETELLWGWEDTYVQINGDYVDRLYRGEDGYMLLCPEHGNANSYRQMTLTFAAVRFEDGREFPEKQVVTLSTGSKSSYLDLMVKLYNRENRKYRVEVLEEWDDSLLERQLVQGKGPDLLNISELYAEKLAELGVFEDLAPYYEASEVVKESDIVESVRKACTINGINAAVMPAFYIETLRGKEVWCAPEEWTVWKFLELGQWNRMFRLQSADNALQYCMGIRYGERFVDWEKKQCSFDSEEFRRMLEACGTWEEHESGGSFEEGDWLFQEEGIFSVWGVVSDVDPDYSSKLIGYPGWDGGEYKLQDYGMYAISSTSENKEGAWDFLEYLLSEEYQGMVDWAFPVRKSNFETSLENRYIAQSRLELNFFLGEPAVPTEDDISALRNMVDSAVHDSWGGRNNPIWNIVAYEAGTYFAGDATLDDTVSRIQNRMQLLVNE